MDLYVTNVFQSYVFTLSRGSIILGNLIVPQINTTSFPEYRRLGTGSAISHGNVSRSYLNLMNTGPYFGSLTLDQLDQNTLQFVVYNYLSALIPGYYPPISGPFSNNSSIYNLQLLESEIEAGERYFTKILGLGLGEINKYRVADPCKNGISTLSENYEIILLGGFTAFSQIKKQVNYTSMLEGYVTPATLTGVNPYMSVFNWDLLYNLKVINGGNTFPQFGWSGSRLGSVLPVDDETRDNSFFNYPSNLLENARTNEPIGIIYAGQGVQCYSYPILQEENVIEFNTRNLRAFNQSIRIRKENEVIVRFLGMLPYQQGRGIYDFVSTEVSYNNESGSAESGEFCTTFPPEGVQPGRNNAFFGVALTDIYSKTLNINNQENASRTPQDTRSYFSTNLTSAQQSFTAHNAPLVFNSDDDNNTFQGLPWTILSSYISRTTSSPSNRLSQKVPILREGITVMICSGAYPLYRASQMTEFSGFVVLNREDRLRGPFSNYLSQYYLTEDFWNPNLNITIPRPLKTTFEPTNSEFPINPSPPFRIKGARITLYENQRVIAGSYIYSSMYMVGNVTLSQFYGPSAKEITLLQGNNKNILQDVYSKYQGNQGGCIVMVSTDGKDPPMVPSCCQPIGIVLEEIRGIGSPVIESNQYRYQRQTSKSKCVQNVVDFEHVYQLQNRHLLVKLFPMYANMSLSGFGNSRNFVIAFPQTVNNIFYNDNTSEINITSEFDEHFGYMYSKIRGTYLLHDSASSFLSPNYPNIYFDTSVKGNQFLLDYFGPENQLSTTFL